MLSGLADQAMRDMAAKKEQSVKGQIGLIFQQRVEVEVRKPRWMPEHTYRWLMRTIVIKEWPLQVTPPSREDFFLAD